MALTGAERSQRYRDKSKAKGLCLKCNQRKPAPGRARCELCKEQDRRQYKVRKEEGRCVRCGHHKDDPDRAVCASCTGELVRNTAIWRSL